MSDYNDETFEDGMEGEVKDAASEDETQDEVLEDETLDASPPADGQPPKSD